MTDSTILSRRLGLWSAWTIVAVSLGYLATGTAWVAIALPLKLDPWTPLDPYRAILEVLILLAGVAMIALMISVHQYAEENLKLFGLLALTFMVLAAGTTMAVHFVELTVARNADLVAQPSLRRIFFPKWPSILMALDFLAWDGFLGLSLLFAAPTFSRDGLQRVVRWMLFGTAVLCLGGLIGPLSGDLAYQTIGIAGYAFAFPASCIVLGILFRRGNAQ
jgi:hypothetical protein